MNLVGNADVPGGGAAAGKNNRIVHDSLRFAQRTSKPAVALQQPKPYNNAFSAYNKPLAAPPSSEEPSSTSEIAALEKLCASKTKPLPPLPVSQQMAAAASSSSSSSNPSIQCNEISSSDTEGTSPNPPPLPTRRRKPSGPPLMTRSRQVEAAQPPQPPRKQPRGAPPPPPAATGYGSDSENHQPKVEKELATTRSTRSSCVRFANDTPPTAVKPLSQRNSRRSEPLLRPPTHKSSTSANPQQQQQQQPSSSPRKQLQQQPFRNPVLTRVLRSRNSLSALSLSPASVITRGRQRLAATKGDFIWNYFCTFGQSLLRLSIRMTSTSVLLPYLL